MKERGRGRRGGWRGGGGGGEGGGGWGGGKLQLGLAGGQFEGELGD